MFAPGIVIWTGLLAAPAAGAPAVSPADPAALRAAAELGLEGVEIPRDEDAFAQILHHLLDHALSPAQKRAIAAVAADDDLSRNEKRRRIAEAIRKPAAAAAACATCRAWRAEREKRNREVRLAFVFRDGREFVHHPETGETITLVSGTIDRAGLAYWSEERRVFVRVEGRDLVRTVYAVDLLDPGRRYNGDASAGPAILRRRDGTDERLERVYLWGFGFRYAFRDRVTRAPRVVEPLDWNALDGRRFYGPVQRIVLAEQRLKVCPADKHLFPFDYIYCPYCRTRLVWSH